MTYSVNWIHLNDSPMSQSQVGSGKSFRLRSFLIGIIIASLTWGASIYLYVSLASNSSNNLVGDVGEAYIPLRDLSSRASMIRNFNRQLNESKTTGQWKIKLKKLIEDGTMYRNSPSLIADLKSKVRLIGGDGPDVLKGISNLETKSDLLESIGLIKNIQEKKRRDRGMKRHAFNSLISSRLSYQRNIPDTRHDRCSSIEYPMKLPSASIIICFYNEEFHALIRSIQSVLDRSNPQNLKDIIVVDDFSDTEEYSHDKLAEYIEKNLPNIVHLFRTPKREGLIRARIFGAKRASGDVLVFLDSHVEANVNWLDPLLTRIKENSSTVVMPIIDVISPETFEYSSSPLVKGGFNWGLHFRWDNVPKNFFSHTEDFVKPIRSPAMAGGLFAIDKTYFLHLGEYDNEMEIWGGENIELSLRVWTCGGSLEIIPCSRVGHIFRRRRPYGSGIGETDSSLRNSVRVAEVWLDEYKDEFYKIKPTARHISYGDITARKHLRQELKCKSFRWYLETIYPQLLQETFAGKLSKPKLLNENHLSFNPRKRVYFSQFQLNLHGTKLCIQSQQSVTSKNSPIILAICNSSTKKQRWSQTDKHELILAELLCLDATNNKLRTSKCHEMMGSQEWKINSKVETPIYNMAAGLCIGLPGDVKDPIEGMQLSMEICSNKNSYMKFNLQAYLEIGKD